MSPEDPLAQPVAQEAPAVKLEVVVGGKQPEVTPPPKPEGVRGPGGEIVVPPKEELVKPPVTAENVIKNERASELQRFQEHVAELHRQNNELFAKMEQMKAAADLNPAIAQTIRKFGFSVGMGMEKLSSKWQQFNDIESWGITKDVRKMAADFKAPIDAGVKHLERVGKTVDAVFTIMGGRDQSLAAFMQRHNAEQAVRTANILSDPKIQRGPNGEVVAPPKGEVTPPVTAEVVQPKAEVVPPPVIEAQGEAPENAERLERVENINKAFEVVFADPEKLAQFEKVQAFLAEHKLSPQLSTSILSEKFGAEAAAGLELIRNKPEDMKFLKDVADLKLSAGVVKDAIAERLKEEEETEDIETEPVSPV